MSIRKCCAVLVILMMSCHVSAFQLANFKWPEPVAVFHVDVPDAGNTGIWNDAFTGAARTWSAQTVFSWTLVENSRGDPCLRDGRNGIGFRADLCGIDFGASTLAITQTHFLPGDPGEITETDIVFNNNHQWDVYAGSLQPGIHDFRRVAVHELGHAMGLAHEDAIPSVMESFQANTEVPQADDVAGIEAIYADDSGHSSDGDCGGPVAVELNTSLSDTLTGECTVEELLGLADVSAVKRYSVTLPSDGRLTVRMESPSFDAFLWLLEDDLATEIALDDDSAGNLNALLTADLTAGTYVLLANSYHLTQTFTGAFTLTLTFTPAEGVDLLAAVLPASRSVQVGQTASVFATLINAGPVPVSGCGIAPVTGVAARFSYRATDPVTNRVTGAPNQPVSIAAGGTQTYVVLFDPSSDVAPLDVSLRFQCDGTEAAAVYPGLNTLLFSSSLSPVPDIVSLAATANGDGIVTIAGIGAISAYSVATVNLGSTGTITVSADTGRLRVPVSARICQTDPASGLCVTRRSETVTVSIASGETPTFAVFVRADGNIPFDPTYNRVFVRFRDGLGLTRGATSVAVHTPPPVLPASQALRSH